MKWSRLLWGLILLGAAAATVVTLQRAETQAQRDVTAARSQVAAGQDTVAALKQTLARKQELEAQRGAVAERLVSDNPFADMEWALERAAAAAGVTFEYMNLSGAAQVEGVPELVRYDAEVAVTGTYPQFIAFLRQLERHKLLLSIPDLDLTLGESPETPFTATLVIGFFGKAPEP